MEKSKIFTDTEEIINDIINLLEFQLSLLAKQGYANQKIIDLQQGFLKRHGIYVPLKNVSHKILYEGYEHIFLMTFIELYKKLFSNWDDSFAQFALRTLEEMGIQRTQILFNNQIPLKTRNKYKLIIWLADYASLSLSYPKKIDTYKKLLYEYKELLTQKEYEFYSNLITQLKGKKPLEEYTLIKEARIKIAGLQGNLKAQTKPLPFIRELNIVALFSSFSHILHGNVLLLQDVIGEKRPNSQKLRIYWGLLLTGVNVINRVEKYLNLSASVECINKNFIELQKVVAKNWESLSR